MVQANAGKAKERIREKLNLFLDKHAETMIEILDHLMKFVIVVWWIWLAFIVFGAITDILNKQNLILGQWKLFGIIFYGLWILEKRRKQQLQEGSKIHAESIRALAEVIQKISEPGSTVSIVEHKPPKKKDKLVN